MVARGPKIEEDLFGRATAPKNKDKDVALISARVLEKLREDPTITFPSSDSVVLKSTELRRIKAEAKILTAGEKQYRRLNQDTRKVRIRKIAMERRGMMIAMDAQRKSQQPLTTLGNSDRDATLNDARRAMDENHEDVKKMNSIALNCLTYAIRDKQLDEKRMLADQEKAENLRMDEMMEIQRLNAMRKVREAKIAAAGERLEGAKMIKVQMAEMEEKRKKEKHERYLEGQALLKRIAAEDAEEERKRLQRLEEGKRMLEEVKLANISAARAKEMRKLKEKEEDDKRAAYIRDKEAREAAYEKQIEEQKAAKDKEIAKIMAAQEKSADQNAEIELLRMKRNQEEFDRRAREKALAKAAKQQHIARELEHARYLAQVEKERLLLQQTREEKLEFEKSVAGFKEQERNDHAASLRKDKIKREYHADLMAQMQEKEDNTPKYARPDEQEAIRKKEEMVKILRIKEEKLRELEKRTSKKYTKQLENYVPYN